MQNLLLPTCLHHGARSGFLYRRSYPWSRLVWYLATAEHRPRWIRVDRLLGEHGCGPKELRSEALDRPRLWFDPYFALQLPTAQIPLGEIPVLERIPPQLPDQSQQMMLSVIPSELPQEVKRLPAQINAFTISEPTFSPNDDLADRRRRLKPTSAADPPCEW